MTISDPAVLLERLLQLDDVSAIKIQRSTAEGKTNVTVLFQGCGQLGCTSQGVAEAIEHAFTEMHSTRMGRLDRARRDVDILDGVAAPLAGEETKR